MIHLLYTKIRSQLNSDAFGKYLQQLPIATQQKILRFRNWQDAERSLYGNLLLLHGLEEAALTPYTLEELSYTEFRKPYFDDLLDFNISHSGAYVVCAFSETCRLGVDIEQIKRIEINDFEDHFSKQEWSNILRSDDAFQAFYSHWTQKEAFLKAIGVGLNLPLEKIFFTNQKILWEGKAWFSQEIVLDDEYVCHLVSSIAQPTVSLKQVSFS